MIRQLFDQESFTFTYLIADPASKEAAIIDCVREQAGRDLALVRELGLRLTYILETHVHADHITGASLLRDATGAKIALSRDSRVSCADILLADGDELKLGSKAIRAIATPGHTASCMSYSFDQAVFTGDTLFFRDVGRTDFQEGSNEKMFDSVTNKLFRLPRDTLVYPAHDYKGHLMSTIGEEKDFNGKLGGGKLFSEFEKAMQEMKLGLPKKIHLAVPANLNCGRE